MQTEGEGNKENEAFDVKRRRFQNPMKSVGMKLFFLFFFVSILVFVFAAGLISYEISRTVVENKVSEASIGTITQAGEKKSITFTAYMKIFRCRSCWTPNFSSSCSSFRPGTRACMKRCKCAKKNFRQAELVYVYKQRD